MFEVKKGSKSFEALMRSYKTEASMSGILLEARKGAHFTGKPNKTRRRKSALTRIETRAKTEYRRKTGKLSKKELELMARRAAKAGKFGNK